MRIDNSSIPIQPVQRPTPSPKQPLDDVQAVLSNDERDYFAELERMGPLTYGRRGAAAALNAPPAPLGQRIDVRA